MAVGARFRDWLVEEDIFAVDVTRELVATAAWNRDVQALQREVGALVVVEKRRFPLVAVMAIRAGCDSCFRELLSMWILVALLAFLGCHFEVHIHQLGFKIRWLVTVDASSRAMRAQQGKVGGAVVELR